MWKDITMGIIVRLTTLSIFLPDVLPLGDLSWIGHCGKVGASELQGNGTGILPKEGSLSSYLTTCMVNHVVISPWIEQPFQILPTGDEWCLPDGFLVESQTCASLKFDIFQPIRHCVENEGFPDLGQSYSGDFLDITSLPLQGTFYLSSRLAFAMCAILDGLQSEHGTECLIDFCSNVSHEPSSTPSLSPSSSPSAAPSMTPSATPSYDPSDSPSLMPTQLPSGQPSNYPSVVATEVPSLTPSVEPSWYPTTSPTASRSWGPGPYLRVKVTLRLLIDKVGATENSQTTLDALEQAIKHSLHGFAGIQGVQIVEGSKAPIPDHAPLVLTFSVFILRTCEDAEITCKTPAFVNAVGGKIARQFRDHFEGIVDDGLIERNIRRVGFRASISSLGESRPRPASSNLMSSTTTVVYDETEKARTSSAGISMEYGLVLICSFVVLFL